MNQETFHIQSCKLINYRKYEEQEFIFTERFSLLVGENATGKTSILEGIACVLGAYLQCYSNVPTAETHTIKDNDIHSIHKLHLTGSKKLKISLYKYKVVCLLIVNHYKLKERKRIERIHTH